MDLSLIDLLRCPFCGTRLDLVDNEAERQFLTARLAEC